MSGGDDGGSGGPVGGGGGGSDKGGGDASAVSGAAPAGASTPSLPSIGGGSSSPIGGASSFTNLPSLDAGAFDYLNAPAGGGGASPSVSPIPSLTGASDGGSLTGFNGNAVPGSSAPGLPGVGITEGAAGSSPGGGAAVKPGTGGSDNNSVMSSLGIKNPLGTAIGAAGLGYAMTQGQQAPKYSPQLEAQANALSAQGKQLLSYLQSGTLPDGLKAQLEQATSAAKAKIMSNFASQGLNTDPTQNSVLAQQLAQVDQQALISTAQMGQQLMQSGLAASGLSSDLYKTLANIDQTQTAAIGKAIANFAAATAGGGGGINLKLG